MARSVYLEAAARTQDLLTAKWMLRSAGYAIASTWHEEISAAPLAQRLTQALRGLEDMEPSDAFVLLQGQKNEVAPELAFLAGVAAARKVRLIWIGLPTEVLSHIRNLQVFATPGEFQNQVLAELSQVPAAA